MPRIDFLKNSKGFTLIEILLAIVIIGILTGVMLTIMNPAKQQSRANDAAITAMVNKSNLSTEGFVSAYGRYPNESEFIYSLNAGVSEKDNDACTIAGVPDDECLYNVAGVKTPASCNTSGWTGTDSDNNQCFFRYKGGINGEKDRFRIYVKAQGIANKMFVFDNKFGGKLHECPTTLTDADGLDTCGRVEIAFEGTGDGSGGSGGGSGGGGGGGGGSSDCSTTDLSISTTSLPNGTHEVFYASTLSGSGGELPYSWNILSGTLPHNLVLQEPTGTLNGTPYGASTFPITIELSDDAGCAVSKNFALVIDPAAPPPPPPVSFDAITIVGRFIDHFTQTVINQTGLGFGWRWTPGDVAPTTNYNPSTGEFSIHTITTDLVVGGKTRKSFYYAPPCHYYEDWIHVDRNSDNSLTVTNDRFDLDNNDYVFEVTDPIVDIGTVELWPSLNFHARTDKDIRLFMYYSEEDRLEESWEGFGYGPIRGMPSQRAAYDYPLEVWLEDEAGNRYDAPTVTIAPGTDCLSWLYLDFYGGNFNWILDPRSGSGGSIDVDGT